MEKTQGLDQSFTVKNFQRLLNRSDFHGSHGYRSIEQLMPRLKQLEKDVADLTFEFNKFKSGTVNGFDYLSAADLEDKLILRKIDDNIKRIFRIKTSNRSAIISLTKHLSGETNKFSVIKLDLNKFYESIPHSKVIESIKKNNLLSNNSKELLSKYLTSIESIAGSGMPRGICLSSTLAEYYMKPIDNKIKSIDGVYYYGRFVDDIIVFTYIDPRIVYKQIKSIIEFPLKINQAKTKLMPSSIISKNKIDFEFLGYRFIKNEKLLVDISRKKVNKIKSRIIYSLIDYKVNSNIDLLKRRIKYLSSNFKLSGAEKKENIISGIHYNYYLASSCDKSLKDLDFFVRFNLLSDKGFLANRGVKIDNEIKNDILKNSFYSGFKKIITHSYSMPEISEIKRCWHGK